MREKHSAPLAVLVVGLLVSATGLSQQGRPREGGGPSGRTASNGDAQRGTEGPPTPLCGAVLSGSSERVRLVLGNGAQVDEPCRPNGERPLLLAASSCDREILKLLLDAGARVDATNRIGYTALMLAAEMGPLDSVKILLDHGASVNAASLYGDTALILSSVGNQNEAWRLLIDRGANVNASNILGRTALMEEVQYGYYEAVKGLLEAGANPNVADDRGRTPLWYAKHIDPVFADRAQRDAIVTLLRSHGANH